MSRKYPYQCGAKNTRINQKRLRCRHTEPYTDAHKRREMVERTQTKLEEFPTRNAEGDFLFGSYNSQIATLVERQILVATR